MHISHGSVNSLSQIVENSRHILLLLLMILTINFVLLWDRFEKVGMLMTGLWQWCTCCCVNCDSLSVVCVYWCVLTAEYDDQSDAEPCDPTHRPDKDSKVCEFNLKKEFGSRCTKANAYGFSKGKPCILVKINKVCNSVIKTDRPFPAWLIGWSNFMYTGFKSGLFGGENVGIMKSRVFFLLQLSLLVIIRLSQTYA